MLSLKAKENWIVGVVAAQVGQQHRALEESCAEAGHYKMSYTNQIQTINSLSVIPTPAREQATVILSNFLEKNSILNLFDYLGKKVASFLLISGQEQVTIDIKNLPPGVYVIQVSTDKSLSGKLIKIN